MDITTLHDSQIIEILDGENDDFPVVDEGEWVDEGKYSYRDVVFSYDGRFYEGSISRSGSYFTEYNYEYPSASNLCEVHQVEKIIKVWETVK